LYCDPAKGATVLCIDEKTGMQALERAHPGRPAAPGRDPRLEFEYVRHGTRTLIAAFNTPHVRSLLERLVNVYTWILAPRE
jgi:hypothetical protein